MIRDRSTDQTELPGLSDPGSRLTETSLNRAHTLGNPARRSPHHLLPGCGGQEAKQRSGPKLKSDKKRVAAWVPGEKVTDKVLGGYRHDFDATPIDTDGPSLSHQPCELGQTSP